MTALTLSFLESKVFEIIIMPYIVVAVIMSFIVYFEMQRDPLVEPSIFIAVSCGIIWPYILYMDLTRK